MNTFQNILNLSCVAAGTVEAYKLVGFDNAQVAAADARVKGVSLNPADDGEAFAALALGAAQLKGTGVITAGSRLVSSPNGGVQAAGAGAENVFAIALTSSADGELVEILIR